MAHIIAICEGDVGKENKAAAERLGLGAYGFFRRGNKRGDKDTPVGSNVKPLLTTEGAGGLVIPAMDDDLALERITQKKRIAVSLAAGLSESQGAQPPEIFGPRPSDRQAVRILADILEQPVETAVGFQNLIIEPLLKNWLSASRTVYGDFEPRYYTSQGFRHRTGHKKQDMQMVRHNGVLKDPYGRLYERQPVNLIADGASRGRAYNPDGRRISHLPGKLAERLHLRPLAESHHIDTAGGVIMPGGAESHRPGHWIAVFGD